MANVNGAVMMSTENLDYKTSGGSCGLGELARSASLRNSLRRQKEPFWILKIRSQLQDQLKCLDIRLENHASMLNEIQDFYKRRAEVELDYSKNMEKLVKQIVSRHRADKRETWPGYSTYSIWQTLLSTTKKLGKDHGVLSELYANQMIFRINELSEDMQRIYKKCREMSIQHHNELLKSLTELQSSMRTYHIYYGESMHAENKFRQVENQRVEIENSNSGKLMLTRRLRNIEKQSEKRQLKYMESRLRAVKARNEYLLCLEAANASMNKYFTDDLHDLINTMDYGYHSTLSRAVMLHVSAENNMIQSRNGCLDLFNKRVRDLDQKADKQTFLDLFTQTFTAPNLFEFQAHKGDEMRQLSGQKSVQDDLIERLRSIAERLNALKVENEEIWKTLETTDNRFLEMVTHKDYDVTRFFQDDTPQIPCSPLERDKHRSDQMETEEFYLNKFHDYQTLNNLIARLQAKYNCIEKALTDNNCLSIPNIGIPAALPKLKRRKVLGKTPLAGQPQLFGGTVVEYVEASGEDIPLIVKSCVRFINLYGMHHQGLFRVSGSQSEINDFKSQFERGVDPLLDKVDGKDVNSVAGVLKLYFRELKEPLFPFAIFQELVNFISVNFFNSSNDLVESVSRLKHLLLTSLPRPVIVLMRYLFAFLNHLSEFSDENMMDPYNLAICFGPTLMPVPREFDQVLYQSHVTELMKNIILFQDDIFPRFIDSDDTATVYERCEVGVDRRPIMISENISDDEEAVEDIISEDELDVTEAVALFDFHGRTDRELSFKKGDTLIVYEKVSSDWWEGMVEGKEGLLPDKYIAVRTRNKYNTFENQEETKFKSTESLPLKSFSLTVMRSDDLSPMSASHPNLDLRHQNSANNINNNNNNNNNSNSRSLGSGSTDSSASSSQFMANDDEDMSTLKLLSAYQIKGRSLEGASTDGKNIIKKLQSSNNDLQKQPEKLPPDSIKININTPHPFPHIHTTQQQQQPQMKEVPPLCGGVNLKVDSITNTEDDLSNDIDTALAEVMMGIHSLGLQVQGLDDFKPTPDLVIDLPQSSFQVSPKMPSKTSQVNEDVANNWTTAEVFANADQCTIKKGQGISVANKSQHQSQAPQQPTTYLRGFEPVAPSCVKRQQFVEKKYATLGKVEAKNISTRHKDIEVGDRNSFGKLRAGPATMSRHHSIATSDCHQPPQSVVPPIRTTSRLAADDVMETNKNVNVAKKYQTITHGTATKISQSLLSKSILNPVDLPALLGDRRVSTPENVSNISSINKIVTNDYSCNNNSQGVEKSNRLSTSTIIAPATKQSATNKETSSSSTTLVTSNTTVSNLSSPPSATTTPNSSLTTSPISIRSDDASFDATTNNKNLRSSSSSSSSTTAASKVKPPIMKKPVRIGELSRRLTTTDAQASSSQNKETEINNQHVSKEL